MSAANTVHRSLFFKKLLTDLRQGKALTECPLLSCSSIIISELDHLSNNCLCFLCTCGKHICPSKPLQEPYPLSSYKSTYLDSYNSKPLQKTPAFNSHTPTPPKSFIVKESLNSESYQSRPSFQSSLTPLRSRQNPPVLMLTPSTNYNSHFKNWGIGTCYIEKNPNSRHTAEETRLKKTTIYKEQFIQPEKSSILQSKSSLSTERKCHVSPNARFTDKTTNKSTYVDHSKNYFKSSPFKRDNTLNPLKSSDNQYTTTSRSDFIKYNAEINISTFKNILSREGLIQK